MGLPKAKLIAVCAQGPTTFGALRMASIAGMGDSIMEGANATVPANRHLNLVASTLGATVLNKGISGTVVQNSNDSGGSPRANNMRDRFAVDLGGINKREGLDYIGGFNDARYTAAPATFNVSEYGVDYRQTLNIALELGYLPEKSVLGTPYWISDTGLNSGSGGFTGQTRSGFDAFVAEQTNAALEYNFYWADTYSAMRDNGGASLIDTDNIHPKDNGHVVIANAVMSARRPNPKPSPTLSISSPSNGVIDWSITAVPDATSYTIAYMPAGGGTGYEFTGAVTGSALSGQFTGLQNNFYTVRARANFAGGLFSGWVPARVRAGAELQASFPFAGTAGTGLSTLSPTFSVQTGYAPGTEPATDGTALYATAAASVYRSSAAVIGQNFYVDGTIVWRSSLTNDTLGICTNMSASANSFYFLAFFRVDNTWRLYRNNNGSNTVVGTWAGTFTSGSKVARITHQVMEGFLRLTASVDGVVLGTYDDAAPLPLGAIGFRFGVAQTSTTGLHLQDLKLYVQAL